MSEIKQEETKRKKVLIIAIVAILVVASLVVGYIYNSQKQYTPPPPTPKVELTGTKDIAKESWIAQSATQMQTQKQEIEDLKKTLSALQEKDKRPGGSPGQFPPGMPPPPSQGALTPGVPKSNSAPSSGTPPVPTVSGHQNNGAYYPPPPPPSQMGGQQVRPGAPSEKLLTNLIAIDEGKGGSGSTAPSKDKQDSQKKTERTKDEIKNDSFIPSGSFVKVVLLNGIDAPTGSKGKGNPYPVLLRVLEFAQLPNFWKGDFKECFMIGEALGELSSERVHIRTSTLSCINRKGEVLEGNISGYAVGEDGKIGLSGRVITKQGALLARSLVTGFLQGVSQAFSQSSNVLNVTPTGNISTIDPNKTAQAGIGMGISKATEDLAKFYIEMAKDLFPVIEANAGRRVEVVLVSKATLAKVAK
jgi:conjugal transfer pilus assembly protein TraB